MMLMGGPPTEHHHFWVHLIETSSLVSCLLLSWSFLSFSTPHSCNEKYRLTAMNIVIRSHMPTNTGWIIFHLCNPFDLSLFHFQFPCRKFGWGKVISYWLPFLISSSKMTKNVQNPGRQLFMFHLYLAHNGIHSLPPTLSSPPHHSSPFPPLTIHPCSLPTLPSSVFICCSISSLLPDSWRWGRWCQGSRGADNHQYLYELLKASSSHTRAHRFKHTQ